ncbi:MAG: MFS transporter [Gracilibacteraceae bacterium]|jgi:MFS family permease|nr:MFS transporter [Gracilibacteraceae bacterium]
MKFSGYRVALGAGLICMASLGFGYLTLSLYLPILATELQASSTVISVMFAVLGATGMAVSFLSGKVIQVIGIKPLVGIGCLGLVLGYVVLYFAGNVAMVYAAAALIGVGLSWGGLICIGNLIPNWFIARQGFMLGLTTGACGIGGIIGNPVVSALIAGYGWRTACLVTVGFMLVLLVPAMFLIIPKPEDVGQTPLGYDSAGAGAAHSAAGPGFKGAVGSASFVFLVLTLIGAGLFISGMSPHVPAMLLEKGADIVFVGTIMAVVSAFNTVGNVLFGVVNDKFGIRAVLFLACLCGVLGMLLVFFSQGRIVFLLFGLLFGLAMPLPGAVVAMMTLGLYGTRDLPQLLGMTNGIIGLVGVFAALITGAMRDVTGSYSLSILVMAGVVALTCLTFFIAYGQSRKLSDAL